MNIYIDVEHISPPQGYAYLVATAEAMKYKAMWSLRHLERQIDLEKGQILLK